MESLSHLLKSLPDSEWRRKAEAKIQGVSCDDPLITKFRQKYPFVDDYAIKINMNKLYQHVSEYKNCSNCPGLDKCPNDMTGHYTMLSADPWRDRRFYP